ISKPVFHDYITLISYTFKNNFAYYIRTYVVRYTTKYFIGLVFRKFKLQYILVYILKIIVFNKFIFFFLALIMVYFIICYTILPLNILYAIIIIYFLSYHS